MGCSPQDGVTLKGVNADWAKAHQLAHVQTRSLQRGQTGFTADAGISLHPASPRSPPLNTSFSALLSLASSKFPLLSFILELVPLLLIVEPLWAHCERRWQGWVYWFITAKVTVLLYNIYDPEKVEILKLYLLFLCGPVDVMSDGAHIVRGTNIE